MEFVQRVKAKIPSCNFAFFVLVIHMSLCLFSLFLLLLFHYRDLSPMEQAQWRNQQLVSNYKARLARIASPSDKRATEMVSDFRSLETDI
jgi:predicted signal transduction protein with EAL and GGDEF domain